VGIRLGDRIMHSFRHQYSEGAPVKVKPSLDVVLKKGWRFDPDQKVFLGPSGQTVRPGKLPARSRIVLKIPSLAQADSSELSEDEQLLARYLQIILPQGQDAAVLAESVRDWESVESVELPPAIGLPGV
jgi:hypothetical protein